LLRIIETTLFTRTHAHVSRPFFRGKPVPEEIFFWTLWYKEDLLPHSWFAIAKSV